MRSDKEDGVSVDIDNVGVDKYRCFRWLSLFGPNKFSQLHAFKKYIK